MSVTICVETLEQGRRNAELMNMDEAEAGDRQEEGHPDWEVGVGIDRHFAYLIEDLPKRAVMVEGEPYPFIRPTDFAAWRAAVESLDDEKSRFHHLLGILERDEEQYIYLSW
jgi:hypothetical protein